MTPSPHLQIISDDLWEKVKARQAAIREASVAIRAALHANARTGRGPKYLFSGLLKCGQCQSNFVIVDTTRYGCSGWRYRGPDEAASPLSYRSAFLARKAVDQLPEGGTPVAAAKKASKKNK